VPTKRPNWRLEMKRLRPRAITDASEEFDGTDFIEFAPDGKIGRVTNFFDE
jgi:hypothetical protein